VSSLFIWSNSPVHISSLLVFLVQSNLTNLAWNWVQVYAVHFYTCLVNCNDLDPQLTLTCTLHDLHLILNKPGNLDVKWFWEFFRKWIAVKLILLSYLCIFSFVFVHLFTMLCEPCVVTSLFLDKFYYGQSVFVDFFVRIFIPLLPSHLKQYYKLP
jgi:hypothetical protein